MPREEYSPLLSSQPQETEDDPGLVTKKLDGSDPKLVKLRSIGVLSAAAIVFGNCVGAGIFISPKGVYEKAGSPGAGLLVWLGVGVISTLCTMAYAELGTMMQESGGEFVYIRNTYGKYPAFLSTFCNSLVVKPASMAVIALTFSAYLADLIWERDDVTVVMVQAIAVGVIVFLAILNMVSCKVIVTFCSLCSVVKLGVIGLLLVMGIVVLAKGQGEYDNFRSPFKGSAVNPADYGLAFLFCAFSFQCWNSLNFITEELQNPLQTLPRGGFIGLTMVTFSYILANMAYLMMFTVQDIIDSNTIAMESGYKVFGKAGQVIMCLGLLMSCMGASGGALLVYSRNIQSTAEDGVFPKWMGGTNRTLNTPVPAILVLMFITIGYTFVDTAALIPCLTSVEWFFYAVTFSCLLYLRYTEPKNIRPFKIPLPIAILLFVITTTFVVLPLFSESSRYSVLLGFCSIPLGTVFYLAQVGYVKYTTRNDPKPAPADERGELRGDLRRNYSVL